MFRKTFRKIFKAVSKYRKIIIISLIIYTFWFFGLGIIGGWLLSKGTIHSFPDLTVNDRILILAPHIDDEVIVAGGLIQEAIRVGVKVKVVYMTNGDNSSSTVITADKDINYDPNYFIDLGENRMREGESATATLGLQRSDIIFLGYPDKGLEPMLTTYFSKPYTSQGTRFNFNPYDGTFSKKQEYNGQNVIADLDKIYSEFKPNIIIVPHPRDKHMDHRATYKYVEKIVLEKDLDTKIYSYLVHYSLYPAKKRLETYSFMYPPKSLFTKEGWYSYDLSSEQQDKKLLAVEKNDSQMRALTMGGFLKSFVRKNEIFELMN
jgi:LmbE family N-acetylglucosaminyl deacetylase